MSLNDITRQFRCHHNHRDAIHEIQCNLHRAAERKILEDLTRARIERLPEGPLKEQLLDLRARARKHIDSTLKV